MRARVAVAALVLLSACGNPNSPASVQVSPEPVSPLPEPVNNGGGDTSQGDTIAFKSIRMVKSFPGYTTRMSFYQYGSAGTSTGVYDLYGKTPRKMKIVIQAGTGVGAHILWTGGDTAKVRPVGLLGALVVDLPLTDDRLLSVRGYTLKQTNLDTLMDQVIDPVNKRAFQGSRNGVIYLGLTGPHLLPGCKTETLAVDARTLTPKVIEMSDGQRMVFHMNLDHFHAEPNVSLDI